MVDLSRNRKEFGEKIEVQKKSVRSRIGYVKNPLKNIVEGKGRVKNYVPAFGLNVGTIHIDREQPKGGGR